jgi:ABC-type uncharacterized transport system permease subunit
MFHEWLERQFYTLIGAGFILLAVIVSTAIITIKDWRKRK